VIVDTSVLIALLRQESDAEALLDRMLCADNLRISTGTLVEAMLVARRERSERELRRLIEEFGIEVVPFGTALAALVIDAGSRCGKGYNPASLNFGDLFAYALSRVLDEPLLSKGKDFALTDVARA